MGFLLLLPNSVRVVIECDGREHYADDTGEASPQRYAAMMEADRDLRLKGYEVYRFGGAELTDTPLRGSGSTRSSIALPSGIRPNGPGRTGTFGRCSLLTSLYKDHSGRAATAWGMVPHEARRQHVTYPALVTRTHPDSQCQVEWAVRRV